MGKDYEVVQNLEGFNFFYAIVGCVGIQYKTTGAPGNGFLSTPNYPVISGLEEMI